MSARLRVLVVDDEAAILRFLKPALEANGYEMASTATIADAVKRIAAEAPDIVLLDLALPGTRGFDGLLELRKLHPSLPIVVVSALEDPRIIQDVMRYGASGFVAKSADRSEIAAALKEVMDGSLTLPKGYKPPEAPPSSEAHGDLVQRLKTLTPKQLSVLRMLRQGLLNKQIAHELQIEETTVKAHVSHVLAKLGVKPRLGIRPCPLHRLQDALVLVVRTLGAT